MSRGERREKSRQDQTKCGREQATGFISHKENAFKNVWNPKTDKRGNIFFLVNTFLFLPSKRTTSMSLPPADEISDDDFLT